MQDRNILELKSKTPLTATNGVLIFYNSLTFSITLSAILENISSG